MAVEVILPRVDMDMTEGKIATWLVRNGQTVKAQQVIFEIETDKATMEVESPGAGVIQGIHGEIGTMMPVGSVVAWLLAPGEQLPPEALAALAGTAAEVDITAEPETADAVAAAGTPAGAPGAGRSAASRGQPLRATPLARATARQHGIDLGAVAGSGPLGRVRAADLARHRSAESATPGPSADGAATGALHRHWWHRGARAPLVLLHGLAADHGGWRPLVELINAGQPVLGIDLPGHGKSPALPVASYEDLAAIVLETLDGEGVREFHLVGHSFGAAVSLALAATHAQRVRSLTLLGPAGLGDAIDVGVIGALVNAESEAQMRKALTALVHDPAHISNSFAATAFRQLNNAERRDAILDLATRFMPMSRQRYNLSAALERLRMPVRVVWGDEDRVIPLSQTPQLPGRVALHRLAEVGHLPHIEARELLVDLLAQQWSAGESRAGH